MLFDGFIDRLNGLVEEWRAAGLPYAETRYADAEEVRRRTPVRIGRGAGGGLVLMEDVAAEAGAPGTESASFLLWTNDAGRIAGGRVRLVGPDLSGRPGEKLHFGLVCLVAGAGLTVEHQNRLEAARHVADRVEGFMVRSLSDRTWGRVHRDALARGFRLAHLGAALAALLPEEAPEIESAEVLVVTAAEAVKQLHPLSEGARKVRRDILVKRFNLREDGMIECADGECEECDDKEVCDDIRDIARIRRKLKQE